MDDETNPLAGVETPSTETSETPATEPDRYEGITEPGEQEVEATTEETGEQQEQAEEPEIADPFTGFDEIEIDGKKYKVPAEIKDGYLRQADYTRKTQEVATMRNEIKARETVLTELAQISEEEIKAKSAIMGIEAELSRYQNVNWQQWMNEDPVEAQSQYIRAQELEKTRARLNEYSGELVQQRSQKAEQETANRLKATAEFAQKNLKGWTPEVDKKISEFAVRKTGLDEASISRQITPQLYEVLYLAMLGEQTQQRQIKPASVPVTPTKTVSAKGNAQFHKSLDEMSMEEYADYRKGQEARARR